MERFFQILTEVSVSSIRVNSVSVHAKVDRSKRLTAMRRHLGVGNAICAFKAKRSIDLEVRYNIIRDNGVIDVIALDGTFITSYGVKASRMAHYWDNTRQPHFYSELMRMCRKNYPIYLEKCRYEDEIAKWVANY
jgi:hypothetical protein